MVKKNVLAKQKSQDTFSLKEKVSSKPVITTQQTAVPKLMLWKKNNPTDIKE